MADAFLRRRKVVYKTRTPATMANRPAKDPPTTRPLAALPEGEAPPVGDVLLSDTELFSESVPDGDPVEEGPVDALWEVSGI